MYTETGNWQNSQEIEQANKKLSELDFKVATRLGQGVGITYFLAAGIAFLAHDPEVAKTIAISSTAAAVGALSLEVTTTTVLRFVNRLRDKNKVWIPTEDNQK